MTKRELKGWLFHQQTRTGLVKSFKRVNKHLGLPILSGPTRDGSWYALNGFYQTIVQKRSPVSNVWTGATIAICVHLANRAIYNHTIETWKPTYDFTQNPND